MKFQRTGRSLFLLIFIAMVSSTPVCFAGKHNDTTTLKEIKQEAQDLVTALKSYTADQRDAAIRQTQKTLDNLDNRIEALETRIDNKWDKMDKTARQKARASLRALRKQRTHVAEWYGGLKNSSVDAWDHMKQGFSDAYKALHKAWEKAETEFESKG